MLPYILAAGATLLSAQAKSQAGGAEIDAGMEDYSDAALSGHFKEKGLLEKWGRTSGTMRARTAASGVAMAGSALEVLQASAGQAARDLFIARHLTRRNLDAADRRIEGGAADKAGAMTGAIFGLGKIAAGAYGDAAKRYKPPGRVSGGVTEQPWMPEYGND